MTAKRFIQVIDGVKDTRTGRVLTHPLKITLKLNEINDLYDCVFNRNEHLEEENEHIKHTIKTMMDTERTELGRSVLKQLWEAIK